MKRLIPPSVLKPLQVLSYSLISLLCLPLAAYADAYELGLQLYAHGNYDGAVRSFLQAANQSPENPNAHYYLADSYLKLNRLSEAQAEYQKILTLAPNSQAARLSKIALGNLRGYMNNVDGNRWYKSGGSGPGEVPDLYNGEPFSGEDYLELVTEGGRRVRWALSKMPLKVYIESAPPNMRNFQPAFISQVRRAMDVWCGVLNHQLSYILVNDKSKADFRVTWTNAIDTQGHSQDGSTSYTAGLTLPKIQHEQLQYMDMKIATFDIQGKPQSIDTVYAVAIHELGHALGLLGHSDNAGDIMFAQNQRVITPSKRDTNTMRKLYSLAADVNNLSPSDRKIDPSRTEALAKAADESLKRQELITKADGTSLNWLNLGVAYFQKASQVNAEGGDGKPWLEKSLSASTQAIQKEPNDPRAYHKRSLVYQELNHYSAALQDIQKSISLDHSEPEYLMLQAWYMAKVGRMGEARASLDSYLLYKPSEANSADVQRIREALTQAGKN